MKTRYQKFVEERIGMPLEQKILQMVQAELTDAEMAAALDVPQSTLNLWRRQFLEVETTYRLRETTAA